MNQQTSHFLAFALVCILCPWIFAFLHTRLNRRIPPILLYFRYFMMVNIFNVGIYQMLIVLTLGPIYPKFVSWASAPIVYFYVAILAAMVASSCLVLFGRSILIIAAPVMWVVFLCVNLIIHATQLGRGIELPAVYLYCWLGDKFIVMLIMLGLIFGINQRLSDVGIVRHGK